MGPVRLLEGSERLFDAFLNGLGVGVVGVDGESLLDDGLSVAELAFGLCFEVVNLVGGSSLHGFCDFSTLVVELECLVAEEFGVVFLEVVASLAVLVLLKSLFLSCHAQSVRLK